MYLPKIALPSLMKFENITGMSSQKKEIRIRIKICNYTFLCTFFIYCACVSVFGHKRHLYISLVVDIQFVHKLLIDLFPQNNELLLNLKDDYCPLFFSEGKRLVPFFQIRNDVLIFMYLGTEIYLCS